MNATFKKMAGAMLSAALLLTGCTVNGGYYEEKYDNPLADTDVGGYNVLTLLEEEELLTLENENVRIILNAASGSVVELVNKESKLYLTREGDADPVRINRIRDGREISDTGYKSFTYSVEEDSASRKALRLCWTFSDLTVSAAVSLCEGADEVVFRLSVKGNSLTVKDGIRRAAFTTSNIPSSTASIPSMTSRRIIFSARLRRDISFRIPWTISTVPSPGSQRATDYTLRGGNIPCSSRVISRKASGDFSL